MTTHDLKIWPIYFEPLADGLKTFEVRKNDRGYRVGDALLLREWVPASNQYTGRTVERVVTYIFPLPVAKDLVVLSVRPVAPDVFKLRPLTVDEIHDVSAAAYCAQDRDSKNPEDDFEVLFARGVEAAHNKMLSAAPQPKDTP